ncbi:hypothetical protein BJP44_06785 [Candidatus Williamhamiltonella defendens]|uniref:Uncharacterized protein n=1 Tax=Hamiltonella defensa subsp. Acyrthosiphon pisum (strain 5AT) TaxID=572265 RepID=C4K6F6_HAMD5|nr:hypothetical protein [Candidatus Hamiltonella defensa]ACQ68149.1 hypothetical protein HDEF_1526 [Candidatus Hamiltonella defensa 5AT (Acyrthosiphon pisum)]ATW22755.1 hypothetical protein BJP44_06785 [Candidatus Hamiltonella defensa]
MITEPATNASIVFFDNDNEMQKIQGFLKQARNCGIKIIPHTQSVSDIKKLLKENKFIVIQKNQIVKISDNKNQYEFGCEETAPKKYEFKIENSSNAVKKNISSVIKGQKNIKEEITNICKDSEILNICSREFLDIIRDKKLVNLEPENQIIPLKKKIFTEKPDAKIIIDAENLELKKEVQHLKLNYSNLSNFTGEQGQIIRSLIKQKDEKDGELNNLKSKIIGYHISEENLQRHNTLLIKSDKSKNKMITSLKEKNTALEIKNKALEEEKNALQSRLAQLENSIKSSGYTATFDSVILTQSHQENQNDDQNTIDLHERIKCLQSDLDSTKSELNDIKSSLDEACNFAEKKMKENIMLKAKYNKLLLEHDAAREELERI